MQTSRENRLFELVAYLVSCSRLSLDEPPIYGSFRLIEAVGRLVDAAEALGIPVDREILDARDSIEANKLRMIDDHDGYRTWLDGLLADIAAEARRRNVDASTA
jgi:Family of unknown function (DUF6092)